jgi:hypothetical protein
VRKLTQCTSPDSIACVLERTDRLKVAGVLFADGFYYMMRSMLGLGGLASFPIVFREVNHLGLSISVTESTRCPDCSQSAFGLVFVPGWVADAVSSVG